MYSQGSLTVEEEIGRENQSDGSMRGSGQLLLALKIEQEGHDPRNVGKISPMLPEKNTPC